MLTALGDFLACLCSPLDRMGHTLSMTLTDYYNGCGGEEKMSVVIFDCVLRPWVEDFGTILIGEGTFLSGCVVFLKGFVALM